MAQPTAVVPTGPIQDVSRPRTSSTKLEDQAALAALYVTKYDDVTKNGREFLDNTNKLSSAGKKHRPECADFETMGSLLTDIPA